MFLVPESIRDVTDGSGKGLDKGRKHGVKVGRNTFGGEEHVGDCLLSATVLSISGTILNYSHSQANQEVESSKYELTFNITELN